MKIININEKIIKNWRMSRDCEKFAKSKTIQSLKRNDVIFTSEMIIKKRKKKKKQMLLSIQMLIIKYHFKINSIKISTI